MYACMYVCFVDENIFDHSITYDDIAGIDGSKVCMYVCMYVFVVVKADETTCDHSIIYVTANLCVCGYICVYVCVYIHTHTYVCMYTDIYIYTYTGTNYGGCGHD